MYSSEVASTACLSRERGRTLRALERPLSTVSPHVVFYVGRKVCCVRAEVAEEWLFFLFDPARPRTTFSATLVETMATWPELIHLFGRICHQ